VWDANATVEKAREEPVPVRRAPREVVLAKYVAAFHSIKWSLVAGLLAGLFVFVPLIQGLRFWKEAAPIRAQRDYAAATAAVVDSDWQLYGRLERDYQWLGGWLRAPLRARLIACGDQLVNGYRNRATSSIDQFDWKRAQTCFSRALALDPNNTDIKGKLKLSEGYLALVENPASPSTAFRSFEDAATLLPNAPDPHLGLARVYLYGLGNLGLAIAELHTAERLGYRLGPREWAMQGDGYLVRAELALANYQKTEQQRWFSQLRRDLDRARDLYEPISGFGNVGRSLERVQECRTAAESLQAERARPKPRYHARYRRWR
jgi:tetratricopeptide (TPR) repeat protein